MLQLANSGGLNPQTQSQPVSVDGEAELPMPAGPASPIGMLCGSRLLN
jgi:hypothetical protein